LQIPDLHFDIQLLVSDPPRIASRLEFDCTPKASFLGLQVNGRKVAFAENVFYEFDERKIKAVWSIIDKAAIERQLGAGETTSGFAWAIREPERREIATTRSCASQSRPVWPCVTLPRGARRAEAGLLARAAALPRRPNVLRGTGSL